MTGVQTCALPISGAVTERFPVVQSQLAGRHAQLLVRTNGRSDPPAGWESDDVSLEELVLAYLREPSASTLPGPLNFMGNCTTEVVL